MQVDSYNMSVGVSYRCHQLSLNVLSFLRYTSQYLGLKLCYYIQNTCLGNPMDRGSWRATVHGITRVGHNWATKLPPFQTETWLIALQQLCCVRLFPEDSSRAAWLSWWCEQRCFESPHGRTHEKTLGASNSFLMLRIASDPQLEKYKSCQSYNYK